MDCTRRYQHMIQHFHTALFYRGDYLEFLKFRQDRTFLRFMKEGDVDVI